MRTFAQKPVSSEKKGSSRLAQVSHRPGLAGRGLPGCSLPIQPKLSISTPTDRYEQEADRVADQVMRMPASAVQRKCTSCEGEEEEKIQRKPLASTITPLVQRSPSGSTLDASSSEESRINSIRGGGQSLSESARTFFEPRFGTDFSHVRVHTDSNAAESARGVNALAYTVGRGVVFGAGQYAPGTASGKRLLAHELTHVVQQQAGVHLRDRVGEIDDLHERHADGTSQTVVDPLQHQVNIQRQTLPSEQLTELPAATETTQSVPGETTTNKSPSSDPLVIEAAVGVKGDNRVDDVAKVQARLLAVGLLSEADIAVESPMPVVTTPTSPSGTEVSDTGITGSTAVAGGTTPAAITEASLTTTIAAIREFQQSLFSKEVVDGNVGPAGRTWRALSATDAATVAKMKEAWGKKKQKMEEESAQKLKAEAESKKLEAWEQSEEAEQQRTTIARTFLARYATYIPNTSMYINLDESGLAGALIDYAKTDANVVLHVFEGLDASDPDDVAYEMACNATDKELAKFDHRVLACLKMAMTGGWQSDEETKQIARINGVLDVQPKATHATMLEDPATGKLELPRIDAETLEKRIEQIHIAYDEYFVDRNTTGDCLKATKAALAKMGWDVSQGKDFIPGPTCDAGLTDAQSKALLAALLAEVEAGNPVVIGVNYKAGAPSVQRDKQTDHWLYIVASTFDDNGQPVLVAYENANVSLSKITDGNIVLFQIDEMGRLYHGAYFPNSKNIFSTESHVVVNFRPTKRMPKP
jgi:hypothetical protein